MKNRFGGMLGLSILAGVLFSAQASAVLINIDVTGSDAVTYFQGRAQESDLRSMQTNSSLVLDIDIGEVVELTSHLIYSDFFGTWQNLPFNPSHMNEITTIFNFGSQSVDVNQQVKLTQISNGMFQTDISYSLSKSIELAGIGTLEFFSKNNSFVSASTEVGAFESIITRFRLVASSAIEDPLSVPAPAGFAFALVGLVAIFRRFSQNS